MIKENAGALSPYYKSSHVKLRAFGAGSINVYSVSEKP
jgi:hypothetical protein